MIANFFTIILYQPLYNVLILLYNLVPGNDFGIAIILLTILIRFLLYPLGSKAIKSQKALMDIQPEIDDVQKKYKDNKEKQVKETLALYKKAKINPFSSILPLLIQLPILLALYRVFWHGLDQVQTNLLYDFVAAPKNINSFFVGLINLSKPNIYLAILAGISQFFQTKLMPQKKNTGSGKKNDFSDALQKQMQYFFPVFTFLLLLKVPSAVGLYWLATTAFSIIQQYLLLRKKNSTVITQTNNA